MWTRTKRKNQGENPPSRNELARARDRLTRYLALRDHSLHELRTKLERNFERELVDKVLEEADANGWLTPEEQIAERLAAALGRRNKSHRYIEAQLRKRKLPVPLAEADDEIERIRHLVERKFGTDSLSFEDKAKAYRFLKYRGFGDRAIRQVLNEKR